MLAWSWDLSSPHACRLFETSAYSDIFYVVENIVPEGTMTCECSGSSAKSFIRAWVSDLLWSTCASETLLIMNIIASRCANLRRFRRGLRAVIWMGFNRSKSCYIFVIDTPIFLFKFTTFIFRIHVGFFSYLTAIYFIVIRIEVLEVGYNMREGLLLESISSRG